METLKKGVDWLIFTADIRYSKDYDKSVGTRPTFEVCQLLRVNKQPRTFLASNADKVATGLYNKLVPQMPGPCEIVKVPISTLIILEDGTRNLISIDRATRAPSLIKSPNINTNDDNSL